MSMIKKSLISVFFLLFLSSCSLIPEPLEVEDNTVLIPYKEALNNIGSTARWGGEIVNVSIEQEYTVLEVVQMALTNTSRPKNENESAGRFKLFYKGLLDPVIYKKGKKVTALGTISDPVSGNIDALEYSFPTLVVQNIYLWSDPKNVRWAVGYNPYYQPYYRHHFFDRNYSRRAIIKRSHRSRHSNRQSYRTRSYRK